MAVSLAFASFASFVCCRVCAEANVVVWAFSGGKHPAGESGRTHRDFALLWPVNSFELRALQGRVYVLAVLCVS